MRPCDCHDQHTARTKLREQGIAFNGNSLTVSPGVVILTIGACTLKIPQRLFQSFAKWYLEDQYNILPEEEESAFPWTADDGTDLRDFGDQ